MRLVLLVELWRVVLHVLQKKGDRKILFMLSVSYEMVVKDVNKDKVRQV